MSNTQPSAPTWLSPLFAGFVLVWPAVSLIPAAFAVPAAPGYDDAIWLVMLAGFGAIFAGCGYTGHWLARLVWSIRLRIRPRTRTT